MTTPMVARQSYYIHKSKRSLLVYVLALFVLALVVAACGETATADSECSRN